MERSYCVLFKFSNWATKNILGKGFIPASFTVQKRSISVASDEGPPSIKSQHLHLKTRIADEIAKNNTVEWNALLEETLKLGSMYNKRNIGAKVLAICKNLHGFNAGKSFLKHLKSSGEPLNLGVLLSYLNLCYYNRDHLTVDDQLELQSMFNTVISKYSMFLRGAVTNDVVVGAALLNRLEEGLKYLEVGEKDGYTSSLSYSALIECAASQGKFDVALKLFEDSYTSNKGTLGGTPAAFVTFCTEYGQTSHIETLLHMMHQHLIIPEVPFAEKLLELSAKEMIPYKCFKTLISSGQCQQCSHHLRKIKITKEDFDSLRSALISDSLIGFNVFNNTNPEELSRFLSFMKKSSPYNVVLDGMNIWYMRNKSSNVQHSRYRTLAAVVQELVSQKRKVLVIAREHVRKRHDPNMEYVTAKCQVYFTKNDSSDDNYLLYAALRGGLGTYFISGDLMRSHKALLSTRELRETFKLWQQSHQILAVPSQNNVCLVYPTEHLLVPHAAEEGTWHIPYSTEKFKFEDDYYSSTFSTGFTKARSWLCLSPSKKC